MIDINLEPSERQLKEFGVVSLVALPALGWVYCGRPGPGDWAAWQAAVVGMLALVGAVLATTAFVAPRWLRPVFVGLLLLFYPIGRVVGEVILVLLYLCVFTPVACFFRLIGRDVLQRRWDRAAKSYWQPKIRPRDVRSYFRRS